MPQPTPAAPRGQHDGTKARQTYKPSRHPAAMYKQGSRTLGPKRQKPACEVCASVRCHCPRHAPSDRAARGLFSSRHRNSALQPRAAQLCRQCIPNQAQLRHNHDTCQSLVPERLHFLPSPHTSSVSDTNLECLDNFWVLDRGHVLDHPAGSSTGRQYSVDN